MSKSKYSSKVNWACPSISRLFRPKLPKKSNGRAMYSWSLWKNIRRINWLRMPNHQKWRRRPKRKHSRSSRYSRFSQPSPRAGSSFRKRSIILRTSSWKRSPKKRPKRQNGYVWWQNLERTRIRGSSTIQTLFLKRCINQPRRPQTPYYSPTAPKTQSFCTSSKENVKTCWASNRYFLAQPNNQKWRTTSIYSAIWKTKH